MNMFKNLFAKFKGGQADGGAPVVERPKQISAAENWEELYAALEAAGGVEGQKKKYSPEELRVLIDLIRAKEQPIDMLTRANNLREIVAGLLIAETDNWEDFYNTLKFVRGVQGSKKIFSAVELIFLIEQSLPVLDARLAGKKEPIGFDTPGLRYITKACGVKAKVVELYNKRLDVEV